MAAGPLPGNVIGTALGGALARVRTLRAGPARAALDVFAIRVAAAGFAYGAQVLMARLMGGAEYGVFAGLWVWTAILGHSTTLGLSQGACRFLPPDLVRGDFAAFRGFLLGGALVTGASGVAVAGLGLGIVHLATDLPGGPYGPPLLVAALVLPLFALQDYLEGVARSLDRATLAIAPPYLLRQGLIMAAMIGAVMLGAPARATVAVCCTLAATGIAVCVQAVLLVRHVRTIVPAGPRTYRWRAWMSACLPIAATDLASAALGFVDVVVLGMLAPPATVGLYFAATRIVQFVAFVHYAASAATAQRFSAANAGGDGAALARLVRMQARATFAATALVGLGVLAAGPLLLGLFGPEFRESLPILGILVAGSVGASLFGPGEDLLTMLGGERVCAAVTVAMLVLAAGLTTLLVARFGATGAAVSMSAVALLRGFALSRAARAIHGIDTPVWSRAR